MRQLPQPDNIPEQPEFDDADDPRIERELSVERDILHFLQCLGIDKNTHFSDCGRPDVENRNEPRPDRLVIDDSTNRQMIIEHMDLRIQKDMPRERYEGERGITFRRSLYDEELAQKLTEAINHKREKVQFVHYPNAEKVLLFRDWVSSTHHPENFIQCYRYFTTPEDPGYDHCYILLKNHGIIIELF